MYDTYLPPFRAAVEAGTASFMAAFNALNGEPSTANPWLLTDVLRKQWGFDGFVTSDWVGIGELIDHGIAADGAEAARKAILAGVDMDMMGLLYIKHLPDEVRAGRVPESVIDESVRRVLRTKFRMGLFDRPDIDPSASRLRPSRRRNRARPPARWRAKPSCCCRTAATCCRSPPSVRSIAVVGPLADAPHDQMGPHAARGHKEDSVTILEGIRRRARRRRHRGAPCPGLRPVLPQHGRAAGGPRGGRSDRIS